MANELFAYLKETVAPYDLDPYFTYAVAQVESSGRFFTSNGYPLVRFEKHVMLRYMRKDPKMANMIPKIETLASSGYAAYQKALAIDAHKAMLSTSFGMFQIMGFNHKPAGYDTVQEFVTAMESDKKNQVIAFCKFVEANKLKVYVNTCNIPKFACAYNGPAYAKWGYDKKLRNAYNAIKVSGVK